MKKAAQAPCSSLKRQVKSYSWDKLVKSRALEKNKQTNKKQAVEFCRVRIHEMGEST